MKKLMPEVLKAGKKNGRLSEENSSEIQQIFRVERE